MTQYDIRVNHVTKTFDVRMGKNTTLKEKILYAGREKKKKFVALQDVSFDIERGSTVALIGKNGSGKSTLLKLISRILYPDAGRVEVSGRVSSLLELGAGFHPDFTGIENIYMNGALLGLSRREIDRKFHEIVDFSELGDFLHEPVRNYSSGMYMRLAFSVAVAVDPEILLIDEILAVGDSAFQAKCINRLKQLRADNKTIVIVTHDTGAVERLCDQVVWMQDSRVREIGDPVECTKMYLDHLFTDSLTGKATMSYEHNQSIAPQMSDKDAETASDLETVVDEDGEGLQLGADGNRQVRIEAVNLTSDAGGGVLRTGGSLVIEVLFQSDIYTEDIAFGIGIFSEDGVECYGTNTTIDRVKGLTVSPGEGSFKFSIPVCDLIAGEYWLDIAIHTVDGMPYHYWRKARKIKVHSETNDAGICRLPHEWVVQQIESRRSANA